MADFVIEKITEEANSPASYRIKYLRNAVGESGELVKVFDNNMTETITLERLQAQRLAFLKQIEEVDAKINKLKELGGGVK